jgi:hydroxyquinol 1,2-dioxygenase
MGDEDDPDASTHPSYRTLVTHIFVRGDRMLDSDAVFGVKPSLDKDVRRSVRRRPTAESSPTRRGAERDSTWSSPRREPSRKASRSPLTGAVC